MKFSFLELINNHNITVPIIQRDYAQGRESSKEIRESFVSKLHETLNSQPEAPSSRLHLDFVYGYVKPDSTFIPLDGQQRLTTLFLLHYYLACKEFDSEEVNLKQIQDTLQKFTYETRVSSERFCKALIKNRIDFDNGYLPSDQIKDAPWFSSSWSNDPTVSALLYMLDTIHNRFSDSPTLWHRLEDNQCITFEFIDIKSDEFKLTDELYIKMNSRGKPLTDFENFKALFADLLASPKSDYATTKIELSGSEISYQQYFAIKIDGAWMDLFWKYRSESVAIDDAIVNVITYLTETLYHINNVGENDFEFNTSLLEQIYWKQENVLFLFKSLDFLAKQESLVDFFDDIFYLNGYSNKKVRLFDNKSTDLFLRAITANSFDVTQKVLMYGLLYYSLFVSREDQNELKRFLRILRNMLARVRQVNQKNRIEYTTNLRLPNLSEYAKFIRGFVDNINSAKIFNSYLTFSENGYSGFPKEAFEAEQDKARIICNRPDVEEIIFLLEDHEDIQGITEIFDLRKNDIADFAKAFYEIWNPETNNSLLIRSLLSYDDYAVMTHESTLLGPIYYFGIDSKWNRILTAIDKGERAKVAKVLNDLITDFIKIEGGKVDDKIRSIMKLYKDEKMDWRYYFVKYSEMTSKYDMNFNSFTWSDNDYEVTRVGNTGTNPLASYHVNPYIFTLYKRLENKKLEFFWGRFSNYISTLRLKGKFDLICHKTGWKITPLKNYKIPEPILNKYSIENHDLFYILPENKKIDRIQNCKNFIEEIIAN